MTTYDVHAHCIPPPLIGMLRSEGSAFGIEVVDGGRGPVIALPNGDAIGPLRGVLGDMDARIAAMDGTGVDVQLISGWIDLTAYALGAAEGAAYARRFNRLLADEVASHPDRLLALGTVPLQSPERAAEELYFAVQELGMVGVEIATTVGPTDLERAALDPFWQAADELRCLVLVHPCNPLSGIDLGLHMMDNMVGRPAESSIAIGHLIFGGILERHPDLVACVVHGGGFIPYQLGRMERGYAAAPAKTADVISTPPAELARRLYYDTVLHDPQALAFMIERIGAGHVVMGSDYPFEMGDPDPMATVQSIPGLSDEDRQLIITGNVARLLDGIRR